MKRGTGQLDETRTSKTAPIRDSLRQEGERRTDLEALPFPLASSACRTTQTKVSVANFKEN